MIPIVVTNPRELIAFLKNHGSPDARHQCEVMAPDLKAGYTIIWPYEVMDLDSPEPFAFISKRSQVLVDLSVEKELNKRRRSASFAATEGKPKKRLMNGNEKWKTQKGHWENDERMRIDDR
jgi:hypothetical protein